MNNQLQRTALLVFSLSATAESKNKSLLSSGKPSSQHYLFSELINRTQHLANSTAVDVVWVNENRQRGNNFAERFSNAYQDLFDDGYHNVVSIGNDCPDLSTSLLKSAIASLSQRGMVAGPSVDGGVYLLGYHKDNFNKSDFEKMSWQQDSLQSDILRCADQNNIQLEQFPVLMDLDSYQDVLHYVSYGRNSAFVSWICSFLFLKQQAKSIALSTNHIDGYTPRSLQLRGPPQV